jgi:hypothetical protein
MKKTILSIIAIIGFVITTTAQVTVTISANGSTTFCSGNNVQLTSSISPTDVYQYQWFNNGTNITGANSASYTANTSGVYLLKVTDLSSNIYSSNSINITVNSLPIAPSINYDSPAIICNGGSIDLTDNTSTNVSYQWYFNNSPISNATNNTYSATIAGTYKLMITDLNTGCSNTSQNVIVGEMPYISDDTIATCGDSTTISLTNPNFSFSTLPASCNVDMSNASIVNTNIGGSGGGGQRKIICYGGELSINGSGSNTFVVEYGGTLNGFGGGGSNTAYVKAGGIYNYNSGGGGSNVVYFEPGAIINGGTTQTVECSSIGVIYPSSTEDLCNNLNYLWSNGATSPTITVNPTQPTTYSVTVSNGSLSCTDQVLVTPAGETPTISASGPTTFCQGDSVVLTSSSATGNTWSNGAITQSITVTDSGSYSVTVSNDNCSVTSDPTVVNINSVPSVTFTPISNYIDVNGSPIQLNGTPSGGTFSGPGVAGSLFYPETAGLGTITITYNYMDSSGCGNFDSQDVIVYDTTGATCTSLTINTAILGLSSPNNMNTITVYPNPASTHINIDFGNYEIMNGYTLEIYNSLGQQVFTSTINQQTSNIDISTLSGAGIYYLKIIDPQSNAVSIRKIVIQ